MSAEDHQRGKIVHALQERAKELNCLYQVGELLNRPESDLKEMLRGIVEVIPGGWQYPGLCQARILLSDLTIEPPNFEVTPWVLSAPISVQDDVVGSIQVSYREQMPRSDEGPFLKEERKLLEAIAERIGSSLMQRRLKSAFEHLGELPETNTERHEWQVVVEFLRDTDPGLLRRIARKLINHLSWTGVPEAKELLQRSGTSLSLQAGVVLEENRPLRSEAKILDFTKEAFQIAEQHLTETEILSCVTTWIKENKAGFLVRVLENQDTGLGEIMEEIERYRHSAVTESELSLSTQKGIRVSLIRRFFSENLDFINVAKQFIEVKDF